MTGVFVDVPNIYFNCRKKLQGRLNYQKLWDLVKSQSGEITRAFAYGCQIDKEAAPFIHCLRQIGFECNWQTLQSYVKDDETKYRHIDLGVTIAMDVVRNIGRFDTLVLVTSNPNMSALVEWARQQGVLVIVIGARIATQLKASCTSWIEISPDMVDPSETTDDSPSE